MLSTADTKTERDLFFASQNDITSRRGLVLHSFVEQVVRDAQTGRFKVVLLSVLFALGLYLWIPPLYHAISSESPAPAQSEPVDEPQPAPIVAETSFNRAQHELCGADGSRRIQNGDNCSTLRDPLVQSAEAAAIGSEVFRNEHDSIHPVSIPEFLRNTTSPVPSKSTETPSVADAPSGLALKSTIIGVNRRAAYINRKLYFEGTTIEDGGVTYELTAVHPDKVVLRQGNRTIELCVPTASPVTASQLNDDTKRNGQVR